MELYRTLKTSDLDQHERESLYLKIRAAVLTVFGIVFFVCWAAIGYIGEKFK